MNEYINLTPENIAKEEKKMVQNKILCYNNYVVYSLWGVIYKFLKRVDHWWKVNKMMI